MRSIQRYGGPLEKPPHGYTHHDILVLAQTGASSLFDGLHVVEGRSEHTRPLETYVGYSRQRPNE